MLNKDNYLNKFPTVICRLFMIFLNNDDIVNLSKLSKYYKDYMKLFMNTIYHLTDIPLRTLIHITFGYNFNQSLLKGFFPIGLKHLTFGYKFNQPIEPDVFPTSLTHLIIGNDFNQPIEPCVFPSSLTHFTFGYDFNQPINPGFFPIG